MSNDSNEIMRQVMARFDHGRAFYARTIANDTGLSLDEVEGALSRLCAQGLVAGKGWCEVSATSGNAASDCLPVTRATDNTRKDRQTRARERVKRAGGHRITVAISAEALKVLNYLCCTDGVSQGCVVSSALERAGEHAGIFSGDAT